MFSLLPLRVGRGDGRSHFSVHVISTQVRPSGSVHLFPFSLSRDEDCEPPYLRPTWVEGNDPPSVDSLCLPENLLGSLITKAYLEQSSLGWNVVFRGLFSQSWRLAQEEQFRLYRSSDPQDSGQHGHICGFTTYSNTFGVYGTALNMALILNRNG